MDNFILIVIIAFSILTFISLTMDDSNDDYVFSIEVVELVLLIIFLVEILLKLFAVGPVCVTQRYLRSPWNAFDFTVVVICLILACLSFIYGSRQIGFLKFSVILRLLRLTVTFRKFSEFNRIKDKRRIRGLHSDFTVDMVSERVLVILSTLLHEPWLQTNANLLADVQWCVDVIRSNKLHDTIVTVAHGKESQVRETELFTLINQYSAVPNHHGSLAHPKRHSSSSSVLSRVQQPEHDLNSEVVHCLANIDRNDFDVFELKRATNGHELFTIMMLLFRNKDLLALMLVPIDIFKRFLSRVQTGYNAIVPYHNATHAADVTQTMHSFLTSDGTGEALDLSGVETAGLYLAACVHDYEHPGVNNVFLVNTQAELAIRYNDKSVLENHHVAAAFALAMNDEYDIFAGLSPSDFSKIRGQMIDMVLSTDISQHFSTLSLFKNKFADRRTVDSDDKRLCFQMLLHAADISNPTKPWPLCYRWTELVISEFWAQGDRERDEGIPVGYMMDRFTVNIAKSQIGFIDVIVSPTFESLKVQFPGFEENCNNLLLNKDNWGKKTEKYDEELHIPAPWPKK